MTDFFPALAHTDNMAYLDRFGDRKIISIRSLMPPKMRKKFLTSLSFDEKIHYESSPDIDFSSKEIKNSTTKTCKIFVDCGAFHYSKLKTPKFLRGGFVNAYTAFRQYEERHLSRKSDASYLLCSPDHIVSPKADNDTFLRRKEFTLSSAEIFFDLCKKDEKITPVGVVHGRNMQERADYTSHLLDLGFEYIAFGGLVPLARNTSEVLLHLTGCKDISSPQISDDSPLGMAKIAGAKTHLFGLNSPEWYRWSKRLGIDSFDGSKLSNEGAANGIIWLEKNVSFDSPPKNASEMFQRMKIKNIKHRETIRSKNTSTFVFSEDGKLPMNYPVLEFLMSSQCTSKKCPHGPEGHICDPRVTGSIGHNMGRTILNSWAFDSIMKKIDILCQEAKISDNKILIENWSEIEVV